MADEITEKEEPRGLRRWLAEAIAGDSAEVVDTEHHALMEAEVQDARVLRKDLDLLAWTALDYMGGNEQDMRAVERRKLVQQSRVAWQQDPQIGATVELMNDFALGRGVPKPKARDAAVQEVLDEAWDDPDNQLVLTSYAAQLQLNTDLSLQCNLFFLVFEGDDGRVKLAMLDHDTVENVVRDPDNRRRILWYVARTKRVGWDFANDTSRPLRDDESPGIKRVYYYAHWKNDAPEGMRPPKEKVGKGKIYHVAINRTGEMAFGHPQMHRLLRWATAFNNLMEARVDLARAAAAFIMKRKVKGTPNQVKKLAEQMLTRRSQIGRSLDLENEGELQGPRAGSVLTENEGVDHETFSLDSQAQNATLDGQMLKGQISAATHFPQHYLGDVGSANLATASAMELVPLKGVESRQEILEQLFRWFYDLTIERAIKAGRLKKELTPEELKAKRGDQAREGTDEAPAAPTTLPEGDGAAVAREEAQEAKTKEDKPLTEDSMLDLGEPTEDEAEDGKDDDDRMRDLSYDFSLPSPIRKMLTDLVSSVQTVATTFDPNNTNVELSRTLLAVVLGEGLEMQDPGEVVEKVFPPGYQDPALAQLGGGAKGRGRPQNEGGGEEGKDNEGNPYGAKQNGSEPEPEGNPYGNLAEALVEALLDRNGNGGGERSLEEALMERLTPEARKRVEAQMRKDGEHFDEATAPIVALTEGETDGSGGD